MRAFVLALALLAAAPCATAGVQWTDTATLAESNAAWGRLARLPDGRWLAVTTRFHGKATPSTLTISLGDARGRQWQELSSVAEAGRNIDNGELIVLPGGRILLGMRSLVEGKSYRLNVHASDDGGRTWRFLSTIDRNEDPRGRKDRGVWEPVFTQLADGALSVLYADETLADGDPSYNQVVSQRLSRDGGASWGAKSVLVKQAGGGKLRPGMPVMSRMQDGRYLLVFEICGDDPQCPVSTKASDDGVAWPDGLGTPLADQRCGPQLTTTTRGTVFVTSCQNEVTFSDDNGAHWQRVAPPAWPGGFRHSWPAIYQLGEDEIGVVNGTPGGGVKIRIGTF
ncbi:sialidase family protein [Lysobacter auxotrophicus]|uniref:Glycoside hydrolase n=1 Tax=Lysobacter auxotrophicus TaxID=2992573 RepID=A0ABN6UK63_9GAMM|nr:sialidase family protein [Lysobacter auxotrophicus]BDU16721.1 glycoside hydrolase [Lysobacter auxotrophicus]